MRVFFHIGMHKTGSTLLQKNIFTKLEGGYYVPRKDSNELKKYILYTDDFEFDAKIGREIFNRIKGVDKYDNIIISDEEFYGNPFWSNMDRKRNIDRVFAIFKEETHFLLFVRGQNSLLNSLYNQYVKTGGSASLNSFLEYKKYPLSLNVGYFLYDKYINYIISKVGTEKFKLYLFEDFLARKIEVVNEVTDFFMCQIPSINESDLKKTNSSLKNNYLSVLRILNKFTKSSKNPFNLLPLICQKAFREIFVKLDFIPLKKNKNTFRDDYLLNKIKESNRSLLENHDLSLEEYNYPL